MITVMLIRMMVYLLTFLTVLLPDYTPPAAADLSAFSVIAWLVPINEIVTLSSILVAFVIASLTYFSVNWVINKGRGSG